jgi:hypothetical protein
MTLAKVANEPGQEGTHSGLGHSLRLGMRVDDGSPTGALLVAARRSAVVVS